MGRDFLPRSSDARARCVAAALASLLIFCPAGAQARSFRVSQVPNGPRFGCGLCHLSPTGGGPRNGFGSQVENTLTGTVTTAPVAWSAIYDRDGDADGYSNGRELGDPDGTWTIGDPAPSGTVYAPHDRDDNPCGDGVLEDPPEVCDSDVLPPDVVCEDFGWGPGTLSCSSRCRINEEACEGYEVVIPNSNNPPSNNATTGETTGMTNDPVVVLLPDDEGGCSMVGSSRADHLAWMLFAFGWCRFRRMKLRRVERRRLAGTVCCLFLLGCSGGDPDPDATGDAAGDGGFNVGNVDGGGVDATIPDPPQNIDPCQATECREGTLGGPPCATFTTDDDFSGGEFGVHGYTSMAWDGADTTIRVDSRGGDWTPILILARLNGEVLFDGDVGAVRPPFEVVATTQADIVVSTVQATGIVVYVTSAEAITTDFQDIPPTDAAYTLSIDSNCGGERLRCFVNGSDTGQPECGWLHYVGKRVITRLEGARDQRLSTAARVTWWSLKEGLLDLDNPIVQSRCGAGDLGPLESCSQSTWRVGLADVDVDGSDIVALEDLASRLYDGAMVSGVLRTTANEAGLDREEAAAVMDSQGELRNSWLLRNSAVGFTIAERGVTAGCIDMAGADCYGTNTAAKRLYAPDRAGALRSIDDLQALFDLMAE